MSDVIIRLRDCSFRYRQADADSEDGASPRGAAAGERRQAARSVCWWRWIRRPNGLRWRAAACSVICIFNMPLMKANSSKVLANKPRSAIACGIPPCAPLKGRYLINATSYVRCIIFKHGGNCLSHHQTDCRCPKMGQYQHCDDCRYRPVTLSGHAAIREGAPSHTTRPPASPPPGPISTT